MELSTEGTNAFAASLREEVLDCALGELIDLADRSRGRLCRRHLLTEIRSRAAGTELGVTGRLKLGHIDRYSSVSTR